MRKLTIVLFALIISSLFLVNVSVSDFPPDPEGEYSPWGDLNDDGTINIFDIVWLAGRYGTTGTPLNVTELLLELDTRMDALNATVMALQEQIAQSGSAKVLVGANSDSTHGVTGRVTVWYNTSHTNQFINPPTIFVQAIDPTNGLSKYGEVFNAGLDQFEVTITETIGGVLFLDGLIDVTWIAIGKAQEASPKECIVATGSKPYNDPTTYISGTGFLINVSESIPSGFTLASVSATGRKTDLGGTTLDEPPLNLLPRVSGTNIEIRVWDAGGSEYDNWSNQRAYIDYTLFITKSTS